jgi:Mitochondrial carrier protein
MSTTEVLQHIVATEGLPGLFKGIQSQLVRTVLASALMLTVKERVAKRTAVILSILVFVMDNPQFVYGMVKKRVSKMFA